MYLLPLFSLVLGWMIEGRDIPGRIFRAVRPFLIAYSAMAFLFFAMPLLLRAINTPGKVQTRRGVISTAEDDQVIPYVQARVAPGENILVYPYLPLYYYLTDTLSASRYEYFQSGMHTLQQAREMIAELSSERVRVVLFEASFWEKIPSAWPETPLAAIAHDPVADYIQGRYRACQSLSSPNNGRFLFMVRKELACP